MSLILPSLHTNISASQPITEQQQVKIRQLEKLVQESPLCQDPAIQKFLDDVVYYRYLRGDGWNMDIALSKLKKNLEWRAAYKPQDIKREEVAECLDSGFLYNCGVDKTGHPLTYVVLGRDNLDWSEKNTQKKFRAFVYIMEEQNKIMKELNCFEARWIVDLKDMKLSISLVKGIYETFGKLADYYVEQMRGCMLINQGWVVRMIWAVVSALLNDATRRNYLFCDAYTQEGTMKFLTNMIPEEELSIDFGGKKVPNMQ